ncbi:TetR/AcrR family transcriptional regulator [Lentilactobacillus sp. Marseille-Q4993]|uniref:TetR/AcrR family transcriptional regulator n=1 Tax=Lentilactobacillus sp. Marseille-Q4993 TaxID=3039492 RepID=UPI0024BCC6F7|nr:TetR/AcrR family transcriptional regulator [Lentilactobacillus sp. Marseille-Q4993]
MVDQREFNSKQAIQTAFWVVLANKGFKAMKVADIIKKASINRSTFYAHYHDKNELLKEKQDTLINTMVNEALKVDVSKYTGRENQLESIIYSFCICTMKYVRENGCKIKSLYKNRSDTLFEEKLKKSLYKLYPEWKSELARHNRVQPKYVYQGMVGMTFKVMIFWINNQYDVEPEQISRMITGIVISLISESD